MPSGPRTLLVAVGRGERGLRGRQSGDRDAERRAGHVVEPDRFALPDRLRVSAVLAADPELDVGPRRPTLLHGRPHEPGDRVVERLERIDRENLERLLLAPHAHPPRLAGGAAPPPPVP